MAIFFVTKSGQEFSWNLGQAFPDIKESVTLVQADGHELASIQANQSDVAPHGEKPVQRVSHDRANALYLAMRGQFLPQEPKTYEDGIRAALAIVTRHRENEDANLNSLHNSLRGMTQQPDNLADVAIRMKASHHKIQGYRFTESCILHVLQDNPIRPEHE